MQITFTEMLAAAGMSGSVTPNHYMVKRETPLLGWDVIHFDAIHVRDTEWNPRMA